MVKYLPQAALLALGKLIYSVVKVLNAIKSEVLKM